MGYSRTAAADRTLDKIQRAARASLTGRDDKTKQNRYREGTKVYMWEIDVNSDREGINGNVYHVWVGDGGQEFFRRVGRFQIDEDGLLVCGPMWMKLNCS